MFRKENLLVEQRKYIRLDSVFPVQFRLLSLDGKNYLSEMLQGFTSNISKGGVCLEINNLNPILAKLIKDRQVKFSLDIEMPLGNPVKARAAIAWVREIVVMPVNKYLIGLNYEEIDKEQNNQIVRYAWIKKIFVPAALTAIILLALGIGIGIYLNFRLIRSNRSLVEQLVKTLQESSLAKQEIKKINKEKEDLKLEIDALLLRIKNVEDERIRLINEIKSDEAFAANKIKELNSLIEKLTEEKNRLQASLEVTQQKEHLGKKDLESKIEALLSHIRSIEQEKLLLENKMKSQGEIAETRIKELNSLVEKLTRERDDLQQRLVALQQRENIVAEELVHLDKKKFNLEKANFDKMYQWLKVHQNPRTGLVMSFEGDSELSNWAFTYDQALAIQAYTNFSDFERARKLLDFFQHQAKRVDGKFVNAYYANDGSPAEHIVHSGPNIWIGIAAVQYTKKTKDTKFLSLAEDIAQEMIKLQNEDKEGGLRGGPNVTWYATEHNLDAYAFFGMLYKLTGKQKYLRAKEKILNWLIGHTYDRPDIPVKRGKGDSTIATDTYAWSIAAIGPETLEKLGMNPDRILEFVEQNCLVNVDYLRPEGRTVRIKGFDFAPQRHVARGGVVSSEWTAQMVMAYKIMADFYYQKDMPAKARVYAAKADEYLAELGNMIISSPSPSGQGEGCLPYATQDFVDTGHGWTTPKGKSTGSVSGTTYALFAYYNYNPLELKD